MNEPLVLPAGIVTLAGTVADVLLLEREIVSPPAGAAVPTVTVPFEVFPPTTELGLSTREAITGGFITSDACTDWP